MIIPETDFEQDVLCEIFPSGVTHKAFIKTGITSSEIIGLKVERSEENNPKPVDSELLSLVDGALEIVTIYKAESPAQIEWKKNWIKKAIELGASYDC